MVQRDLISLHSAITHISHQLQLEPPRELDVGRALNADGLHGSPSDAQDDNGICELSPPASPSAVEAPIDSFLATAGVDSVSGVETSPSRRRVLDQADLIGKGILSIDTAASLVQAYLSRLDRFIYGIASKYRNVHDIRKASPILLAAICTVSAFHDPEQDELFNACNREYRQLVSSALFEKRDDELIRALCIGSFWLPDASRILSSDAIRRAADVRLHRQFLRLNEQSVDVGDDGHANSFSCKPRDSIALWYLLFVCDQHLSILHNRDGLLKADMSIVERRNEFISGGHAQNADIRLVSQVELLAIMAQIRDALGCDTVKVLPKSLAVQFSMFGKELDEWFTKFSTIFGEASNAGSEKLC